MNQRWYQPMRHCLLCIILSTGSSVIAQEAETTGDSVSTETMTEASLKNNETNPDTIKDGEMKTEVVEEAVMDTGSDEVQKTAVLRVIVVQKGENNQPIKDARVIVTYDNTKEFGRKTDSAGVALLTDLPYGKVDVDVTSSGRHSDGRALVLEKPDETLTFILKHRDLAK